MPYTNCNLDFHSDINVSSVTKTMFIRFPYLNDIAISSLRYLHALHQDIQCICAWVPWTQLLLGSDMLY